MDTPQMKPGAFYSYRTVLADTIEKMNMVADAGSYLLIHKDEIVKALRQCGPNSEAVKLIREVFMHPNVMAALSMRDFRRAVDFMDRLDATKTLPETP